MKNNPLELTKHHIIPQSRINGKKKGNICKVPRILHERYHALFGNMTPIEIIEFLNEVFWKNAFIIERR